MNIGIAGALLATLAPGRGSSHDLHWLSSAELRTMHTPHSHWLLAILNLSPKPWVTGGNNWIGLDFFGCPGRGDSQAAHWFLSFLLTMQHTEQVQVSSAGLNLSPKPDRLAVVDVDAVRLVLGLLTACPGFGVSHAAHFVLSFLLTTQQMEHVQESSGGLNLSPKPLKAVVVG